MKDLPSNNLCSQCGDMLAYLYNEMTAGDRDSFEMHLAECGHCIDDFAELSQSRYPVYQWKRTEFDALPTPRMIIPSNETAAVSWFDSIRAAISFRPTLAFGGLGAAMMMAVVTGYMLLAGPAGEAEMARDVEPTASPIKSAAAAPPRSVETAAQLKDEKGIATAPRTVAKASISERPSKQSSKPLLKPTPAQKPKRNDPIPVMSSIDDDEDETLRLADIFEEIGTSE